MTRWPALVCAALLAAAPLGAHADAGTFRCTFNADAAQSVTLQIHVLNAGRAEITYPNGVRVPYDMTGSENVHSWRSNHNAPVRYEFDSSRRLAWARVPAGNRAALSADQPFNARLHRRAAVPGATPPPQLQAFYDYSAACEVVP